MSIDPVVKQALKDIKEAACAAYEIAVHASGTPLTSPSLTIVDVSLMAVENRAVCLLDPDRDPSFDPPDAGIPFTPIDTTGFDLARYATSTKEEACEALDRYCEGNNDDTAARHVRRLLPLLPGYRRAAGL